MLQQVLADIQRPIGDAVGVPGPSEAPHYSDQKHVQVGAEQAVGLCPKRRGDIGSAIEAVGSPEAEILVQYNLTGKRPEKFSLTDDKPDDNKFGVFSLSMLMARSSRINDISMEWRWPSQSPWMTSTASQVTMLSLHPPLSAPRTSLSARS
mmetsp:Transcript_113841/g.367836  ORF Transcript_113841/g.367836 Transcript_113841/m.367836 type:complete len:151 (-) Transcript_113841:384-836(-)